MLRVLQFVVSDHAASSHAPCARATQQSGRAAQRRSLAYQLCRVTAICIATDRMNSSPLVQRPHSADPCQPCHLKGNAQ